MIVFVITTSIPRMLLCEACVLVHTCIVDGRFMYGGCGCEVHVYEFRDV